MIRSFVWTLEMLGNYVDQGASDYRSISSRPDDGRHVLRLIDAKSRRNGNLSPCRGLDLLDSFERLWAEQVPRTSNTVEGDEIEETLRLVENGSQSRPRSVW